MRQTPPQLHHRPTNLLPQRHVVPMVMHRRRRAAVSPEVHAAHVVAVFDAGAVIAVCDACACACAVGVGGASAEARHECWALRGGAGGGCAVAVSVAHFWYFVFWFVVVMRRG